LIILEQTSERNIYDYTDQKLKAHVQNNEEFNLELANTFAYYKEKLLDIANESDNEQLEADFFNCIKSQIFNGYFMVQELLSNEETKFVDEWFLQSVGMIAQQLPEMLRIATNDDIEGIITHEPLKKLASKLVVEFEGVYPLLMDISLNTACMGAKWALIDEAEKRGISPYQPQLKGLLFHIDDAVFINPQTYLSCDITTESSEVWTVITSGYSGLDKIAEVTVIKHRGHEGSESYYMNINIKNSLSISDQEPLIDTLAIKLMAKNEIGREQLQLYASSVEEFYQINNPTA
jgi:hypothetical protein